MLFIFYILFIFHIYFFIFNIFKNKTFQKNLVSFYKLITRPILNQMIPNFNSTWRNNSKFYVFFFLFSGIKIPFTGKENPFKHQIKNFELLLHAVKI